MGTIKGLLHEYICKAKYNIDYALTCKTGELVTLRHNKIVNVTADTLLMVCKGVRKESILSANVELRADISIRSFW